MFDEKVLIWRVEFRGFFVFGKLGFCRSKTELRVKRLFKFLFRRFLGLELEKWFLG